MNLIRKQLGVTEITCVDYDDIKTAAPSFTVEVKVVNSFFDAATYSSTKTMEYAQTFTKTSLMSTSG